MGRLSFMSRQYSMFFTVTLAKYLTGSMLTFWLSVCMKASKRRNAFDELVLITCDSYSHELLKFPFCVALYSYMEWNEQQQHKSICVTFIWKYLKAQYSTCSSSSRTRRSRRAEVWPSRADWLQRWGGSFRRGRRTYSGETSSRCDSGAGCARRSSDAQCVRAVCVNKYSKTYHIMSSNERILLLNNTNPGMLSNSLRLLLVVKSGDDDWISSTAFCQKARNDASLLWLVLLFLCSSTVVFITSMIRSRLVISSSTLSIGIDNGVLSCLDCLLCAAAISVTKRALTRVYRQEIECDS